MPGSWGVVVPVKRLTSAKTRLAAYGDAARQSLALAFAADVVVAAMGSPLVRAVLVVTDDEVAANFLAGLGARVAPDAPGTGLNPALEHGAALLRAEHGPLGIACLSADLPTLRSADLTAALMQAGPADRVFVADVDGAGTTLLGAGPEAALLAGYGPGSGARHRASGATELAAPEHLRRDVDTPADLEAALQLGVGAHTAAAAARLSRSVQATARDWDASAGGSALLDDGTVVALPPDALAGGAFRFLRSGQRVQLHLQGELVVRADLPGR